MTLPAFSCRQCGALYFPARLRCQTCGGFEFKSHVIDQVQVKAVTRVHRKPPNCSFDFLVQVEAKEGLQLIAAAQSKPEVGAFVSLQQLSDGAVFIQLI